MRTGVSQRNILGPFLFNLCINDIVNISINTKFIMYADDTSLFFAGENVAELFDRANLTLSKVSKWSKCKCLKINTDKTKAVLLRSKNKNVNTTWLLDGRLTLDSSPIELVYYFKICYVTPT